MTIATADDVSERLGRALNPEELVAVEALLEDAEVEIRRSGAGAKLTDPTWRAHVISVECDMVLRAARLSANVSVAIPATESIENNGTLTSRYQSVFLTRGNRRTLGLKLNGVVSLTPAPEPPPEDGWGCGW